MNKNGPPTRPTPLATLLGCDNLGNFDAETDTYILEIYELHPEAINLIGTVHGGAINTLLDHACGMAIYNKYGVNSAVTQKMVTEFFKPLLTRSKISITVQIVKETGQKRGDQVEVYAKLESRGILIAEMHATWLRR